MSYFDIARPRRAFVQSLQNALERLEEREKLTPGDPSLIELKRLLLKVITESDKQRAA
jgi:hypothetical protein